MPHHVQNETIPPGYTEFAIGFRNAYKVGNDTKHKDIKTTLFYKGHIQGLRVRKEEELEAFLLHKDWVKNPPGSRTILKLFYKQMFS